jgi:hypothetical protein
MRKPMRKLIARTLILIGTTGLVTLRVISCAHHSAQPPVGILTSDPIHDDDSRRDFTKTWHYQVTPEVLMDTATELMPWLAKCDSLGCDETALSFSDQLIQRDGRQIGFDCNNVADKIIDRDLVPKVEAACKMVHAAATAYWKGNNDPSEFTDSAGKVWKRQP